MPFGFFSLFKKTQRGFTLYIKVHPGAKTSGITSFQKNENFQEDPELSEKILKISIKESPEKGRANAALLKFLSKTWKIPKSQLFLLKGETSSSKILLIEGNHDDLEKSLICWMEKFFS